MSQGWTANDDFLLNHHMRRMEAEEEMRQSDEEFREVITAALLQANANEAASNAPDFVFLHDLGDGLAIPCCDVDEWYEEHTLRLRAETMMARTERRFFWAAIACGVFGGAWTLKGAAYLIGGSL